MAGKYNPLDQFSYMGKLVETNSPLAIAVGPGQWLVGNIVLYNPTETDLEPCAVASHIGFVEYTPQNRESKKWPYSITPGSWVISPLKSSKSKFTNEAGIIAELGHFILDAENPFPLDSWQLVVGLVREDVKSIEVSSEKFPEQVEIVKLTEKTTFCWMLGRASEISGNKFIFVAKNVNGEILGQAETSVQIWVSNRLGNLLKQYGKVRLCEFIVSINGKDIGNSVYFRYLTDDGEIKLKGPTKMEKTELEDVIQVVKTEFNGVVSSIENITKRLNEIEDEEQKKQFLMVLIERKEFKQILTTALHELEAN